MRVIAILAAHNERRFIAQCLEHLSEQGIDAYLIDNCSTDETVKIAERWLNRNLVAIESFPRGAGNTYNWLGLLQRKEQLARELDADWFIHVDPDEVRLPPWRGTLSQALTEVDSEGFNAVNFNEFTFLPTREEPDHDHRNFERTLRTYYPFSPRFPHHLNAWKATPEIQLASSGGHRVRFPGLCMYPRPFRIKHYLFLSVPHAIEKYVERHYDPAEVESGWHGWRAAITPLDVRLPHQSELLVTQSEDDLNHAKPWERHYLEKFVPSYR